jgi:VWFA-related protein
VRLIQASKITIRQFALLLAWLAAAVIMYSQAPDPTQTQTYRVKVGLVQTDVMVFDKQGHFVPDLKKEQFELRLNGKVQPIEFFEMVSAGSTHDREVWAKGNDRPLAEPAQQAPAAPNPGRTLLIFLDDWHMAADNTVRSRTAIANLLNTSMGPNDRVGIYAASGQLSAMQELTNDKAALLASLDKFNYVSPGVQDLGYPPMTEAQALLIEQKDDGALRSQSPRARGYARPVRACEGQEIVEARFLRAIHVRLEDKTLMSPGVQNHACFFA